MKSPYSELWDACDRQKRIGKLSAELDELRAMQAAFVPRWMAAFGPISCIAPNIDNMLCTIDEGGITLRRLPYSHDLPREWPDEQPAAPLATDTVEGIQALGWGAVLPAEAATAGGEE